MFDERKLDHGQVLRWAIVERDATTKKQIVAAFRAGIANKQPQLWSALGSWAMLMHIEHHRLQRHHDRCCGICGTFPGSHETDLNDMNFERFKWGGVRHDSVLYAAHDLSCLRNEGLPVPVRNADDCLIRLLQACHRMSIRDRGTKLPAVIAKATGIPVSSCASIADALSYAGVLRPAGKPSFIDQWINYSQVVSDPPDRETELNWPLQHWKGLDGVHIPSVAWWFGRKIASEVSK